MSGGTRASLRVVDAGWGTTVQDRGRPGMGHLGVPLAGAIDRDTHDLVNRLVGNPDGAATLETLGGLVVEAMDPVVVARSTDGSRHTLEAGQRLRVGAPSGRLWGYLAVRGGVEVASVLESRSHDTLSGIGPPPVRADTTLPVGEDPLTELIADLAPLRPASGPVRVWPGPHVDWFEHGIGTLTSQEWTVSDEVGRVGCRLTAGSVGHFSGPEHLRSAGLVTGAVQVTPSGEPIVMLANHPTTGGYPVVGVVEPDDLGVVAQSPPGTVLRFITAESRTT